MVFPSLLQAGNATPPRSPVCWTKSQVTPCWGTGTPFIMENVVMVVSNQMSLAGLLSGGLLLSKFQGFVGSASCVVMSAIRSPPEMFQWAWENATGPPHGSWV